MTCGSDVIAPLRLLAKLSKPLPADTAPVFINVKLVVAAAIPGGIVANAFFKVLRPVRKEPANGAAASFALRANDCRAGIVATVRVVARPAAATSTSGGIICDKASPMP